jgi:tetratricopeptide (TPR) repeat protein
VLFTVLAYQLLILKEGQGFTWWMILWILIFGIILSIASIIPHKFRKPYGVVTGNDAYLIIQLLRMKHLPAAIFQLGPLAEQGKLDEAIAVFETKVTGQKQAVEIDRMGIWLYMQKGDFSRVLEFDKQLSKKIKYGARDFINVGYAHSMLANQQAAVEQFTKALALEPDNPVALSNISYSMVALEQYEDAIAYATRAISINPEDASSLDNRGLARLRLGLLEEGKADIDAAIRLDDKQPEVYRNLGIYHLLKQEWTQALVLFEKAKEMNTDTADIGEYIIQAKAGQKG